MQYWARGKKRMEPGSSQLCPVTRGDGHKWEWGRLACRSIGPSCPSWKWGWLLFSSSFRALLPVATITSKIIKRCLAMPSASSLSPCGCIPSGTYGCPLCFSIPWPNPLLSRWLKDNFFIFVFNWKWYICLLATRWCLSDSINAVQALTRTYLLK